MSTTTLEAQRAGNGVHFDADRFQQWHAARPNGDDTFDLDGVADLLAEASGDPASGWMLPADVDAIDFWHIPDPDGPDGGAFVSVSLRNGLSLRAPYRASRRWNAALAEGGVRAVLRLVAEETDRVVGKVRAVLDAAAPRPDATEETDHEVIVYVRSEDQLRRLERAIGVQVYELGWRGRHTLELGVRLDRQYRLDEAVRFAQMTGVRYREVIETTVEHPAARR
jgi:hypothetical protein